MGIYAKNSIEHVAALLAIFKVRAVAINVNYRYVEGELNYLIENSDMVALLHERTYADLVARTAPKHATLKTIVAITDPTDPDNQADLSAFGGITWDEALAGQSAERDFAERSADDRLHRLHRRHHGLPQGRDVAPRGLLARASAGGIDFMSGERMEEFSQSQQAATNEPMVTFPLSPLMHGGAQAALLMHLFAGHLTILEPAFDPVETWQIIDREKVQLIFMTGDAMARPADRGL